MLAQIKNALNPLTSISVLLASYYCVHTYKSISLLIDPLSHPSYAAMLKDATLKNELIKPVFDEGAIIGIELRILNGDDDEDIVLWSDSKVSALGASVVPDMIVNVTQASSPASPSTDTNKNEDKVITLTEHINEYGLFIGSYKALTTSSTKAKASSNTVYNNIALSDQGLISKKMSNNETIYASLIITLQNTNTTKHRSRRMIKNIVPLTKSISYTPPITKRYLPYDIIHLLRQLFKPSNLDGVNARPPWYSPTRTPQITQHWKPTMNINIVSDNIGYPYGFWKQLDLDDNDNENEDGEGGGDKTVRYLPKIWVDEVGLTSTEYIPLLIPILPATLPIQITLNPSTSPARHRLISQITTNLHQQKSMGFSESDIDDVRNLLSNTSLTFLSLTLLASVLHALFEFLAFKSDIAFWRKNTTIKGLSVRHLFVDLISQIIVLLYLHDQGASLLVTFPSFISILIALWKVVKASGLTWSYAAGVSAERLNLRNADAEDLLTLEIDEYAFRTVGKYTVPPVVVYAVYELFFDEHSSWYTYIITTLSTLIYTLGFILLTPQLFLNHKLQTVSHLPWNMMIYKFFNTFIDDLFSFVVRMPWLARVGCLRDDVVFGIYIYQRWIYPVDLRRVGERGEGENDEGEGKKMESKKTN